jgi:hypothetical protein
LDVLNGGDTIYQIRNARVSSGLLVAQFWLDRMPLMSCLTEETVRVIYVDAARYSAP